MAFPSRDWVRFGDLLSATHRRPLRAVSLVSYAGSVPQVARSLTHLGGSRDLPKPGETARGRVGQSTDPDTAIAFPPHDWVRFVRGTRRLPPERTTRFARPFLQSDICHLCSLHILLCSSFSSIFKLSKSHLGRAPSRNAWPGADSLQFYGASQARHGRPGRSRRRSQFMHFAVATARCYRVACGRWHPRVELLGFDSPRRGGYIPCGIARQSASRPMRSGGRG
jgi:hypothetical protein